MNTRHNNPDHFDLPDLSVLDPATRNSGDRSSSFAAQQMLTRILETPPVVTEVVASTRNAQTHQRSNQRRPLRRRPWALASGAAAIAIGVAASTSLGSGDAAFASWTPAATTVAPAEAALAQADCLAIGPDPQGEVVAALTERRGDFTFTLVATDDASGQCLLIDEDLVESLGQEEQGFASWGQASDLPIPPADGTNVLWGASSSSAAGDFTSALGRVGSDVVAVQIDTAGAPNIQASVGDGYFTAWWPGHPERRLTVTTTLTDGTRETRTLKMGDS